MVWERGRGEQEKGAFVVPSVFGLLLSFIRICWDLGFFPWGSLYLKNIRNVRYPFSAPGHMNLGY